VKVAVPSWVPVTENCDHPGLLAPRG
jgi:hypothetical protein